MPYLRFPIGPTGEALPPTYEPVRYVPSTPLIVPGQYPTSVSIPGTQGGVVTSEQARIITKRNIKTLGIVAKETRETSEARKKIAARLRNTPTFGGAVITPTDSTLDSLASRNGEDEAPVTPSPVKPGVVVSLAALSLLFFSGGS